VGASFDRLRMTLGWASFDGLRMTRGVLRQAQDDTGGGASFDSSVLRRAQDDNGWGTRSIAVRGKNGGSSRIFRVRIFFLSLLRRLGGRLASHRSGRGQGTRLRPLTYGTPKPMVPIMNVPFLARTLQRLYAAGSAT